VNPGADRPQQSDIEGDVVAERTTLEGRAALVTGSSRNLGAVIARHLAAAGATVAVTYRESRVDAESLVADLAAATGRPHVAVEADVRTVDGVRAMVEGALTGLGGTVHVLVNNAGPFSMTPFAELSVAVWDEVWNANVRAAWYATRLVVSGMRSAGWGRIVNLSAGSAYIRNHSIYGLAKDAMGVLTEELALEFGPEVAVNAVAPGQIAESAPEVSAIDPTFVDRALARTPKARLVTRDEIASIVVALCGPEFDMVTGATIPVDGGWHLNRF
jgi:NAD(P)-dependent dehydrogenase (short-subunit alcohol dehydrogenase family)